MTLPSVLASGLLPFGRQLSSRKILLLLARLLT
jgi:hypothetical protein